MNKTIQDILRKFLVKDLDNPKTLKSIQESIDNLYPVKFTVQELVNLFTQE